MKITQIHTNKPQSLSFEIFPPKKEEDFKNIDEMLEILCDCHPQCDIWCRRQLKQ